MGRHPTLRRKLRRDIRRTWPLFTALVVMVMLGIALYVAADNSYRNLQGSYDNAFTVQGFPDLFVTGGDVKGFTAAAAKQPYVAGTRTRVQADLPVQVTTDDGTDRFLGRIVGYPTSGKPEVAGLTSLSGAPNPAPGQVLLEEHMAGTFGLTEGDTVTLTTAVGDVDVEVAGVVSSAEYLWLAPDRQQIIVPPRSFGVMFVSEADARIWSGGPDNQSLVLLTDAGRADPDNLSTLRADAIAAGAVEVLDRAQQPSNSLLQEDISGFEQMAAAFPALFLSAAALVLYVLLTRRVEAERQVIGTLRAHGMRARTLGWHYLSYGLLAGVIGALLGLPVGAAMAGAMSRMYTSIIGLPEQLTVFRGFTAQTMLVGLSFAVVATTLAALAPARRAARTVPAEAMRGEVPQTHVRLTWAERIVPRLGRASATWKMIVRGIGRNTRRTVFSASGVALALILVLASWGMIDTMNHLISVQFDKVSTSNGQVEFDGPVTQKQLDQVAAVDGVSDVESVITMPVSAAFGGQVYSTQITAFNADTVMHGFIDESGNPVPLPSDGVLVDDSITEVMPDLKPGDTLSLTLGSGADATKVEAPVAAFTVEPLGTYVYADKAWLARQVPGAEATTAMLTTEDGADPDAVRRAVSDLPGVLAYVDTSALSDVYDQYSGLFYVFVGAMLALGAAMAFAIIFTTMSVNIVERKRELATMRAAGVRYRSISRLVGGENALVAALGVIPGLILGVIAAKVMLDSYSSDQFTLNLYVNPLTLVLASAAIMGVAVLSQIPGLRAVRRMDVAEVVRERAA
ncbi:MAG: ABC transporter permease [Candidatus Nanopelagicales bacterium]